MKKKINCESLSKAKPCNEIIYCDEKIVFKIEWENILYIEKMARLA